MANETIRARIEVLLKGVDQVESLKNAVRQLQTTAAPASADLQKLKQAAMALGSASGRTENDLRRSINALKDVRAQLAITDAEYRKLTGTINKYQAQLDKATGAQQKAGRGMQFAQTAGAVAASGVFGGPEGLVGAGIGAFFGPGGALAGGAIGAQVGAIRQQLGGTATLAADLEKQRTALRLVLKDASEYNSALAFLSKTSKDYAIPQDVLIKGFTQLAASVKGAGGNITDTKTAFQGVAAGIRGTGGSLENLNAALLATSQVFSKGKVTAEELRGQIGERLPGAFTLFAQSIGKTPQELDKALEAGEVSLADFLKFSKTVFGEYGENAKIIADSPAAAGDRLQTNLKNLGESVGKLLQPVGAAFQDTFSEIVKYIDAAARKLADFLGMNKSSDEKAGELNNLIIVQNRAIERERAKLRAGVTTKEAAEYSIREFEGRVAKLKGELSVLRSLEKASAQQKAEKPSGLTGGADPKGDLDRKALDKAAADAERLAAEQRRLAELNADQQLQLADAVFKRQVELDRKRFELNQELIELQRQNYIDSLTGPRREIAQAVMDLKRSLDALDRRRMEAQQAVKQAEQEARSAAQRAVVYQGATAAEGGMTSGRYIQGGIGPRGANQYGPHFDIKRSDGGYYSRNALDPYVRVNGRPLSSGITVPGGEYGAPRSYGGHAGRDYAFGGSAALTLTGGAKWMGSQKGAYGDAAAFMTPDGKVYKIIHGRFEGTTAKGQVAAVGRDIKADTSAAVAAGNVGLQRSIAGAVDANARAQEIELRLRFTQGLTRAIDEQTESIKQSSAALKLRNQLQYQGVRPELIDMQLELSRIEEERAAEIAQLTTELQNGNITQTAYKEGVDALTSSYNNLRIATEGATMAQVAPGAALSERIGQLRQEIAELANFENMLISISQTMESEISGAISSAVSGLVSGSANIKQTLSQLFASIGKAFIDMAAKIIAKQLIMFALNKLLGFFGGGGGNFSSAFGGGSSVAFNPASFTGGFSFATGGVMTSQGARPLPIKRYATGGVANSPQMAMFGERGPEAYVPLPDGRTIPVKIKESQRANAMDRYRPVPGSTAAVGPDGQPITGGAAMANAAGSIDVRYTVERINNVEYVTAEQFRQGMQSAALEGASRGEQQTLRRLQNAPSARRRIGI